MGCRRKFLRRVLWFVFLVILVLPVAGVTPKQKKVAIFSDPDFPIRVVQDVAWYEEALKSAGYEVQRITLEELLAMKSTGDFDILFLPTGGRYPLDAETKIGMFLDAGKMVVLDGHALISDWEQPPEILAAAAELRKNHLDGLGSEAYRDFQMKQGVSDVRSNLLRYDSGLGRWMTPINDFSYHSLLAKMCSAEFHLEPWPNYEVHSLQAGYTRSWKEPIHLNPLIKGLSGTLPQEIVPSSEKQLARVQMPSRDSPEVVEFGNDLLIPVYLFDAPSGKEKEYSGFPKASGSEKDREGDFYIYRMNRPQRLGATLVQFGEVGGELLRGKNGKEVLLSTLAMAAQPLPGEHPPEYVQAFNESLKWQSKFATSALNAMATLEKAATHFHYVENADQEQTALAELTRIRRQYERLSEEGKQLNKSVWKRERQEAFLALTKKNQDAIKEIEKMGASYAAIPQSTMSEKVKNPLGTYQLGFGTLSMPTEERWRRLWPLLKDSGFTFGPYYMGQAGGAGNLAKFPDMNTGYRLYNVIGDSAFSEKIEDGVLNPRTGEIQAKKMYGYSSPEKFALFLKDAIWFLKTANNMPGVGNVVYATERDLEWSLWGDWMRDKFLDYLKSKYQNTEALNKVWGTTYQDFQEIQLPRKRPETQSEHALWEDWTRYRELYILNEEIRPFQKLVREYAPNLRATQFGSYDQQAKHPANGINYYEIYQGINPTTFEMGPTKRDSGRQILAADITSSGGRNLTSEWAAMYFPSGFTADRTDLIKQELWNGVGWGQVGIQTFVGATQIQANFYEGNVIDFHENPLANLAQYKNVTSDFKRFTPLILDGERKPPLIQIMYSPTTRRHTAWPEIAGDQPLAEVAGWWDAARRAHYPARALDEGAVLDGKITAPLLIVSDVSYLPDGVQEKLREYVKNGGTLLVSPRSGHYDEYGKIQDSLLSMAGVIPSSTQDRNVRLPQGFLSLPQDIECVKLTAVNPQNAKTVLTYENGSSAALKTSYGKGHIIVLGFPFGQGRDSWSSQSEMAASFMEQIAQAAGLEREYQTDDADLVIWPWSYQGKDYLILTYPTVSKLTDEKPGEKGFPFRRQAPMKPFELKVKGRVSVKDVLLGENLPTKFQGNHTVVSGLIATPGGVVLELGTTGHGFKEASLGASVDVKEATNKLSSSAQEDGGTPKGSALALPFQGQLFAADSPFDISGYRLHIRSQTDGEWQGKVWLDIEHQGETIAVLAENGEEKRLNFLDSTLVVKTEGATAFNPTHWQGTLTKETRPLGKGICDIYEESFYGQRSVVLVNDYVKLRILPELGGRIIEFSSADGGINHLYVNSALLNKGKASSWAPFGGIHYNPGGFPGTFWDLKFHYKIEKSKNKVALILERTHPVSWEQGSRGSGKGSLAGEISLRQGEAVAHIRMDLFNEGEAPATMRLRTHGMFAISGGQDTFSYPKPTEGESWQIPLSSTSTGTQNGGLVKNEGGWFAISRGGLLQSVVEGFEKKDVANIIFARTEGAFGAEATSRDWELKPGEKGSLAYTLSLLRGLRRVNAFTNGLALSLNIETDPASLQANELMTMGVATANSTQRGQLTITQKSDKHESTIFTESIQMTPLSPFRKEETISTPNQPDGEYQFSANFSEKDELALRATVIAVRNARAITENSKRLAMIEKQLQDLAQKQTSQELEEKISSGLLALFHARDALNKGDKDAFDSYVQRAEHILQDISIKN